MTSELSEKPLWYKNPVGWGILSSLAVCAFALSLGLRKDECLLALDCPTKLQVFLNSQPNEIGDTLAGFAGTLAFIWIIVTVWLQSKELAAQRQELRLTRMEMKEQSAATQDMARSMQAQAAVFEDEKRQRFELRSQDLFDQLLSRFIRNLRQWKDVYWEYYYFVSQYEREIGISQLAPAVDFERGDLDEVFMEFRDKLEIKIRELSTLESEVQEILTYPSSGIFNNDLDQLLDRIEDLFDDLSEAQQERLRSLNIPYVKHCISRLRAVAPWGDEIDGEDVCTA